MLEDYFVRPQTVERIRSSWIGSAIEQYVARLEEQGYATQRLGQRVPILVRVLSWQVLRVIHAVAYPTSHSLIVHQGSSRIFAKSVACGKTRLVGIAITSASFMPI